MVLKDPEEDDAEVSDESKEIRLIPRWSSSWATREKTVDLLEEFEL